MANPEKDATRETPIPEVWRPTLSAVVESLVRRESSVGARVASVDPTPPPVSQQCHEAVDDYGKVTLIPLPDESWDTSVALWFGDRWGCLVDLWTEEEGRSDLALDVDVFEHAAGYRFRVNLVYVP